MRIDRGAVARRRASDDDVEIAVAIEIGDGETVGARMLEADVLADLFERVQEGPLDEGVELAVTFQDEQDVVVLAVFADKPSPLLRRGGRLRDLSAPRSFHRGAIRPPACSPVLARDRLREERAFQATGTGVEQQDAHVSLSLPQEAGA